MPLLRRLVAQIVSHLFGPEHATAALEPPTRATSPPCDPRLLATWNLGAVDDKENGLDFAAGRWKDVHGDDGHGPIDAYDQDPWGLGSHFSRIQAVSHPWGLGRDAAEGDEPQGASV